MRQIGNSINDGNLIHALIGFKIFIENKNNGEYQITSMGKVHYESLVEEKEQTKANYTKKDTIIL